MHIHRSPIAAACYIYIYIYRGPRLHSPRINNWGSHTRVRRSNELAAASEMHPFCNDADRGRGRKGGPLAFPPRRGCAAEPLPDTHAERPLRLSAIRSAPPRFFLHSPESMPIKIHADPFLFSPSAGEHLGCILANSIGYEEDAQQKKKKKKEEKRRR